ncbi:MAG: biopolymer transporter ExbD [Salinisphaeraceae bacterium]|nr:biopolymer transporter ExbD [Salinisphaeraceae bacterium]
MNLSSGRRDEPEINLTSLIDVVFLLLIFFMVTTTFVRQSGLDIRLPDASASAAGTTDEAVEVIVDAADTVYVSGRPLQARKQTLREAIDAASEGDYSRPLRIKADGRASHQTVVTVMDLAAEFGFERVDIATQAAPEGENVTP